MSNEDIRSLAQLAGLVADRDLAALARVRVQMASIRQCIHDLRTSHQVSGTDHPSDPAFLSGAHQRWAAWKETELRRLSSSLAKCAVEEDDLRKTAAKAYGNQIALEALLREGPLL